MILDENWNCHSKWKFLSEGHSLMVVLDENWNRHRKWTFLCEDHSRWERKLLQ